MSVSSSRSVNVVAVSGSPSATSKSARLLDRAVSCLEGAGARTQRIALATLPATDLLGRTSGPYLEAAMEAVGAADIVVVSTPVYRATFSGLLKVFFDLMPRDGLRGKVGLPLATGAVAEHRGVISDVARLFESLGARVVETEAYGLEADFADDRIDGSLTERVDRAAREALELLHTSAGPTKDRATTSAGDERNVVR
jgi:FMN reductase